MKTKFLFIMGIFFLYENSYSQVGISTNTPQGTFHVDGAKDNLLSGSPTVSQQANDFIVTSQGNVGIGTTVPNSSAMLDINVNNLPANGKKGILFPQVALASNTDLVTIPNPVNGLIVYNLVNSGVAPNNVIKNNLYRFDSTLNKWFRFIDETTLPTGTAVVANALGFQASGNDTTYLGADLSGGSNIRQVLYDKINMQGDAATYDLSTKEFIANKTGYFNFQINLCFVGPYTGVARIGISRPYTGTKPTSGVGNNTFAFLSQKDENASTSSFPVTLLSTGMVFMNAGEKIMFLTRYINPATNSLNVESINYNRTLVSSVNVVYYTQ